MNTNGQVAAMFLASGCAMEIDWRLGGTDVDDHIHT